MAPIVDSVFGDVLYVRFSLYLLDFDSRFILFRSSLSGIILTAIVVIESPLHFLNQWC